MGTRARGVMMSLHMKIKIISGILCLFFSFFVMCSREDERKSGMASSEDVALVEAWSTTEKSPLLKLLALYDNGRFLIIETADVGGKIQYQGTYKKDDNIIFTNPDRPSKAHGEFFLIHEDKTGVKYLTSSTHNNLFLHKCVGLDDVSDWGSYIQNDRDFHEKVSGMSYGD